MGISDQIGGAEPVRCASCHGELRASVSYCPFCGAPTSARPAVPAHLAAVLEAAVAQAMELPSPVSPTVEHPLPGSPPPQAPAPQTRSGGPRPAAGGRTSGGAAPDLGAAGLPWGDASGPAARGRRVQFVPWLVALVLVIFLGGAYSAKLLWSPPGKPAGRSQPAADARPPRSGPAAPANGGSAATPSKSAEVKPPPRDEVVQTIRLSPTWSTITLPGDAGHRAISLRASEPFRVRSNGRLYVVAGGAPVALDLDGTASVEARAVSGSVSLSVVASANGGGVP